MASSPPPGSASSTMLKVVTGAAISHLLFGGTRLPWMAASLGLGIALGVLAMLLRRGDTGWVRCRDCGVRMRTRGVHRRR